MARVWVLILGIAMSSACSGTSSIPGLGSNSTAGFCKVAEKLPEIAAMVSADAVKDPATFDKEFRTAVDAYLAELDLLATRAPKDVEKQILLLMSAVDQYKFTEAIVAKAPIDIYIVETCGPAALTPTSS